MFYSLSPSPFPSSSFSPIPYPYTSPSPSLSKLTLTQASVMRSCLNFFFLILHSRWCYFQESHHLPHVLIWGAQSLLINEVVIGLCMVQVEWLCPQSILGATCLPLSKMPCKPFPVPSFSFRSQDSVLTVTAENILLGLKPCNNRASEEEREYSTAMVFPYMTTLRLYLKYFACNYDRDSTIRH